LKPQACIEKHFSPAAKTFFRHVQMEGKKTLHPPQYGQDRGGFTALLHPIRPATLPARVPPNRKTATVWKAYVPKF
jgi:hypothetical protein